MLMRIQNDLFDLAPSVARPEQENPAHRRLRITTAGQVAQLSRRSTR